MSPVLTNGFLSFARVVDFSEDFIMVVRALFAVQFAATAQEPPTNNQYEFDPRQKKLTWKEYDSCIFLLSGSMKSKLLLRRAAQKHDTGGIGPLLSVLSMTDKVIVEALRIERSSYCPQYA